MWVYSASVPAEFGSAEPRRGALNIDSGFRGVDARDVITREKIRMRKSMRGTIKVFMVVIVSFLGK